MYRDVRLEQSGTTLTPDQRKLAGRRRRRAFAAGTAVEEEPPARVEDWRDAAEKRADEKLLGNWWRCKEHGPTQESHFLGDAFYCPAGDCVLQVLQVHAAINDPENVERRTASSQWRDSAGQRAMRERAGLEPQKPVIQRRLLEEPSPRPVAIGDEDLDVDEGSEVAPDVDEVLDQEEEPVSEGSDAVDASPPATEQEPPMPEPEKVPASVVILEALQKRAPLTRQVFINELRARRPDLDSGHRVSSNVSAALHTLLAKRSIERNAEGEFILAVGAPPAAAAPRRRKETVSTAPSRALTVGVAFAEYVVLVKLTPSAIAQIDKLRGSDWLALTREDVAARVLLEALRRIGEAA